ncbi:MAG: VanZ family protein [Thermosediminibacteraceae bacterium]|nr:VanZ family protein [Thermosediminibacteraceae bacterium]
MKKRNFNSKLSHILLWSVFCLYMLLLVKAILFKYPASMMIAAVKQTNMELIRIRILLGSNFVPMKTVFHYLSGEITSIGKINIIANVILFIPLGFLIPFLVKKFNKFATVIGLAFVISLIFELIQLIFGIGNFDIDDLILNSFGAMIGFVVHVWWIKCVKKYSL